MAVSQETKIVTPHEALSRLYSPSPTFYLNRDKTIAAVNKTGKWFWGNSANDLLGLPFGDLYLTNPKKVGIGLREPDRTYIRSQVAFEQTYGARNFTHYPVDLVDPPYGDADTLRHYQAWVVNLNSCPDMGYVVEFRSNEQFGEYRRKNSEPGVQRYFSELQTKQMLGDEKIKYVDFQDDAVESLIQLQAPNINWHQRSDPIQIINEISHIRQPLPVRVADVEADKRREQAEEKSQDAVLRFLFGERVATFFRLLNQSERAAEEESIRTQPFQNKFNPRSAVYDRNTIKLDQEDWWNKIL
jgi:hypothetical protein